MKTMSHRQRMANMIRGRDIDRVPFVQYGNMGAPNVEVWEAFGRESMGILGWSSAYRIEYPNCSIRKETVTVNGQEGTRSLLSTPRGNLTEVQVPVPSMTGPTAFVEHYIKTVDDYVPFLAFVRDWQVVEDPVRIVTFNETFGEMGIPHVSTPRTPFQQLWTEWVLLEDLVMHMYDAPDILEEVMTELGDHLLRVVKATAAAARTVEFFHVTVGDNITAPVIGPDLYRKWCMPYYKAARDLLSEEGIAVYIHMDGDLKPLWSDITESSFDGFDSFSPVPDNDTTVAEALRMWPDKTVWANFPSSVHLQDPDRIYEVARDLLEQGGHSGQFWIQISEDMPKGAWKKSYPEIIRAINDFGDP